MSDKNGLIMLLLLGAAVMLFPKKLGKPVITITELPLKKPARKVVVQPPPPAYRGPILKRGIRNKNPGNLKITKIPWKGKIPIAKNTDKVYEQFTHAHFGIRAMVMDIKNDITKDKLNTLTKLMNEYAPKKENPTKAYINFLVKKTGLKPNQLITEKNYLELVKGIIQFENGMNPYSDTQIMMAIQDAYSQ